MLDAYGGTVDTTYTFSPFQGSNGTGDEEISGGRLVKYTTGL